MSLPDHRNDRTTGKICYIAIDIDVEIQNRHSTALIVSVGVSHELAFHA